MQPTCSSSGGARVGAARKIMLLQVRQGVRAANAVECRFFSGHQAITIFLLLQLLQQLFGFLQLGKQLLFRLKFS